MIKQRTYEVLIGNSSDAIKYENSINVECDIKRSTNEEPNDSTITLYNVNSDNVNKITSKVYNKIVVNAGYNNNNNNIFNGVIVDCITEYTDDNNYKVILSCKEAIVEYGLSVISTTLNKGWTDEDIIKECVSNMKIKVGKIDVDERISNTNDDRPITLHANCRDELTRLAIKYNSNWYIDNGALYFIKKDKSLKDIKVISMSSGLIGHPKITATGVSVSMLLDTILINSIVKLDSINTLLNGFYKVKSVAYSLRYGDGNWQAVLELQRGEFK